MDISDEVKGWAKNVQKTIAAREKKSRKTMQDVWADEAPKGGQEARSRATPIINSSDWQNTTI